MLQKGAEFVPIEVETASVVVSTVGTPEVDASAVVTAAAVVAALALTDRDAVVDTDDASDVVDWKDS